MRRHRAWSQTTDDRRRKAAGNGGSRQQEVGGQKSEVRGQMTDDGISDCGFGIWHRAWSMEIKAGKARKTRKGSQVIGDG